MQVFFQSFSSNLSWTQTITIFYEHKSQLIKLREVWNSQIKITLIYCGSSSSFLRILRVRRLYLQYH
jgi:hypothetical protein